MDRSLREDALALLHEALTWRLPAGRWPTVERQVRSMAAALAAADPDRFVDAVQDLESEGPVRAQRIEDVAPQPAPEPVRERIHQLVHTLDGPHPGEGTPANGLDDDAVAG
ncbi:CATRA system-associated protein [Streptomyces lavendofoliae]|uniref:CATRA system-associated protein n=1 Tax=Streptomyces lavendofoliae TaxID=67314 RepID=UPI003D8FCAEA